MTDSKKQPRSASTPNSETSEPQLSRIRERAYQLYEERGRQDGHAEEDWLRAEAEITDNTLKKSTAA